MTVAVPTVPTAPTSSQDATTADRTQVTLTTTARPTTTAMVTTVHTACTRAETDSIVTPQMEARMCTTTIAVLVANTGPINRTAPTTVIKGAS